MNKFIKFSSASLLGVFLAYSDLNYKSKENQSEQDNQDFSSKEIYQETFSEKPELTSFTDNVEDAELTQNDIVPDPSLWTALEFLERRSENVQAIRERLQSYPKENLSDQIVHEILSATTSEHIYNIWMAYEMAGSEDEKSLLQDQGPGALIDAIDTVFQENTFNLSTEVLSGVRDIIGELETFSDASLDAYTQLMGALEDEYNAFISKIIQGESENDPSIARLIEQSYHNSLEVELSLTQSNEDMAEENARLRVLMLLSRQYYNYDETLQSHAELRDRLYSLNDDSLHILEQRNDFEPKPFAIPSLFPDNLDMM